MSPGMTCGGDATPSHLKNRKCADDLNRASRRDNKCMKKPATFRIWRDASGGEFRDYTTEVSEGMVVLDAVHRHSGDAGERPRLSLELQGGQVRLVFGGSQRHAEADVHDATERSAA